MKNSVRRIAGVVTLSMVLTMGCVPCAVQAAASYNGIVPLTSTQTSYYSNKDVKAICDNYIYCFNDVVPYANSLYQSYVSMDEHPILGLFGGFFSIGSSLEPLEHFIEAKDAFDRLETSKMTQDQRSYYYATQQSVDSTELGIIFKVIEFVGESGLLE